MSRLFGIEMLNFHSQSTNSNLTFALWTVNPHYFSSMAESRAQVSTTGAMIYAVVD